MGADLRAIAPDLPLIATNLRVVSAAESRALDSAAIGGDPARSRALMERAARAVCNECVRLLKPQSESPPLGFRPRRGEVAGLRPSGFGFTGKDIHPLQGVDATSASSVQRGREEPEARMAERPVAAGDPEGPATGCGWQRALAS